jgi:hypothetical protein
MISRTQNATAHSQQPTANSQQPTANGQQPNGIALRLIIANFLVFKRHEQEERRNGGRQSISHIMLGT